MKNSTINYDTRTLDGEVTSYQIKDYTSKSYDLTDMLEIYDTKYIDYYILANNEKIEELSYRLYNSASYWDILLLINFRDPLFGLVYDQDNVISNATNKVTTYVDQATVPIIDPYLSQLINEQIDINTFENESLRTIKIIRPSMINEFMRLIRKRG